VTHWGKGGIISEVEFVGLSVIALSMCISTVTTSVALKALVKGAFSKKG
jgi:hypothetical protein